ncbi:MAG: hypothetical protein ACTSYX_04560 [Candidatus Thorarchaeota archaeon]
MIETHEQAFDEMNTMLFDAWEADSATAEIPIVWGNVAPDKQGGADPFDNPQPYLRVETIHADSRTASLKGPSGARREYNGSLVALLHIQADKGAIHALPLISVASDAFTGTKSPGGVWFRNPRINSIGPQGTWYVTALTVTFIYDLIR